eukprot:CAMPEP_0202835088 /NCGR_PEP_ID=MMETSP1389-20130828/35113_1 /ASSEMBLY_ACC=CAM_ASM_000865 /TAXON_ID=302021 /ORGANISM="Rhodomonas sp., Strain CCMP768" /LENGTH=102 /DNA_ID=CAMNT_0049510479 /DNA_START=31 /DNA_END=336 /DNA_ORIENTATION=+
MIAACHTSDLCQGEHCKQKSEVIQLTLWQDPARRSSKCCRWPRALRCMQSGNACLRRKAERARTHRLRFLLDQFGPTRRRHAHRGASKLREVVRVPEGLRQL